MTRTLPQLVFRVRTRQQLIRDKLRQTAVAPGVTVRPSTRSPPLRSSFFSTHQTRDVYSRGDALVDSAHVVPAKKMVEVQWEDGHTSQFNFTWLRVNCLSSLHENGQKTVFPGDVDSGLQPVEISTPESLVNVKWSDGQVSVFKADWLRTHDNSPSSLHESNYSSWPSPLFAWDAIPKMESEEYMQTEGGLYKALKKVNRTGICLLENLGTEEGTALKIARRIAPESHNMLYGSVFDVVPQKQPRNVAYTSERLRLHMDLVYYESPPGLQILHCMEFDEGVKGGESTFLDAFAAADYFREHCPEMFEVLTRVPATFHKVRAAAQCVEGDERNIDALTAASMQYQRPHIQVDTDGDILAVTWAPMFEGVLMCATQDAAPYYEAYRAFQHLIENDPFGKDHTVSTKLEPGQALIFNNRRLLHGREAFSQEEGNRRLQGCYVNIDDAMSRLRSLHADHPPLDDPVQNRLTRPGNGSLVLVEY